MQPSCAVRLGLQRILAESNPAGFESWFQSTQKRRTLAQVRFVRFLRTRLGFPVAHLELNNPRFQRASVTGQWIRTTHGTVA